MLYFLKSFPKDIRDAEVDFGALIKQRHLQKALGEYDAHALLPRIEAGENRLCIVDVREKVDYDKGHIPGAVSMPIAEIPEKHARLLPGDDIVIYCYSADCILGAKAGYMLALREVYARELNIGWKEWRARGYPTERSDLDTLVASAY